jgi:hypothetical protein
MSAGKVASLRSVNHPGVVPILDSWVSPQGEPCLVMPFVDRPALREVMAIAGMAVGLAGAALLFTPDAGARAIDHRGDGHHLRGRGGCQALFADALGARAAGVAAVAGNCRRLLA